MLSACAIGSGGKNEEAENATATGRLVNGAFALDAVMIELNFTVGPAIVATIRPPVQAATPGIASSAGSGEGRGWSGVFIDLACLSLQQVKGLRTETED